EPRQARAGGGAANYRPGSKVSCSRPARRLALRRAFGGLLTGAPCCERIRCLRRRNAVCGKSPRFLSSIGAFGQDVPMTRGSEVVESDGPAGAVCGFFRRNGVVGVGGGSGHVGCADARVVTD